MLTHRQPNTLKVHTLTESCPGINCGASCSIPGLEGDRTFKDGLSIFWDSKELEPALKTKEKNEIKIIWNPEKRMSALFQKGQKKSSLDKSQRKNERKHNGDCK